MPRKLTQIQASLICQERGCTLLSDYKGSNIKVKIKWGNCQHTEFKTTNCLKGGQGCGICHFNTLQDVKDLGLTRGFEVLSEEYKAYKQKLEIQWDKCGHIESKSFKELKIGNGCGVCFFNTFNDVKDLGLTRGFEILSKEYKNSKQKLEIKWVDCQHVEYKRYRDLQQGIGCGECFGTKKLTLQNIVNSGKVRGFEVLSKEYKNNFTKLEIKWYNCQHIEFKRYNDIQQGYSCGKCWAEATRSNAEIEIFEFVKSLCPDAISSDRDQIYRELDIYVPSQKVGIEYNGLFWHSAKLKSNNYHLDKLNRCEAKDIRLITIFENEWLTRPEVVKAYLRSILSKPENRVFARKCVLQKVTWPEIKPYLDQNHIQGRPANSQHSYVLKHDNQIIAAMTFSYTHSRNPNNYKKRAKIWELTRYCVRSNYQIIGGFQKLFKAFLREVDPPEILSFSDRRWSVGGLYERSGFKLDKIYKPSYWYFENGQHHKLHHKSGFQKKSIAKKLGELLPNETESEAMDRFGYLRIYDCGLIRWVWTNK